MSVTKVKCDETRKKENVANAKATAAKYQQFHVEVESLQNEIYEIKIYIVETVIVSKWRLLRNAKVTVIQKANIAKIRVDLTKFENKGTIIPEEMENTELLKLINDLSKGWQTKIESSREILIQIVI